MNKYKVYIEGYEVGFKNDTLGTREKIIRLVSGEAVSIDENFIYKSIEPEKVKIPQFVADWIEKCEAKEKTLLNSLLYTPEGVNSWVGNSDNQELFARAWLDGYTIEEKRYRVKMKAIKSNSQYLVFGQLSETWWFGSAEQIGNIKSEHTRKEIEDAGFGEVFNSPLFEVKEVE